MRRLILMELRKFFHSRVRCILILFLLLFPLLALSVSQFMDQRAYTVTEGVECSVKEYKEQADKIRFELGGTIDQAWLDDIEAQLQEYEHKEENRKNVVRYQVMEQAYADGKDMKDKRDYFIQDSATPERIKEDMRAHSLHYGPYEGWLERMNIFEQSAMIYLIVSVYLFANMFNQEDVHNMSDMNHAAKLGKKKIAVAKVLVTLMITVFIGLAMYGMLCMSAYLLLDLSGADVTALMMGNSAVQVFTFQELDLQAWVLFMTGGISCAVFAGFASSLLKKPLHSLGAGAAFLLLPQLLPFSIMHISWQTFMPSRYIRFSGISQIMQMPWISFNNAFTFRQAPFLFCLWLFIVLLLCCAAIWLYDHKKHQIKRKRVKLWN